MHYSRSMMSLMENLMFSSPLLGEELSIWPIDFPKNGFQDGASLDTTIQLTDGLVSSKQDSIPSNFMEGDESNPIPDWMSEKMDVGALLDSLANNSITLTDEHHTDMLFSPANELIDSLVADDTSLSPDPFSDLESTLSLSPECSINGDVFNSISLPASPENSICSNGTAVDSGLSSLATLSPTSSLDVFNGISSPASPGNSICSDGTAVNSGLSSPATLSPTSSLDFGVIGLGSHQEIDDTMEVDEVSLEFLINSCKNSGVFKQITESMSLQFPMPGENEIKPLLEDINKMQREYQGKIKPKISRGKYKSKAKVKERKERKKGQNKEAATRYRQKKKKQAEGLSGGLSGLEKTNGELKEKVGSLEQEISYLKELLQEIYKVKGQIKILQSP